MLLTVATGALDAMSFLRLGQVFSSVMTGNLVQLGIAAGTRDGALATQVGVALGGFALGVLAGAAIAGPAGRAGNRPGSGGTAGRPGRVTAALAAELLPLAGCSAWWIVTGGHPAPPARPGLLALAALAMGMQSAAVRTLATGGVSSTYLTGTLTGALAQLVHSGPVRWRGFAVIAGLLAGAVSGGVLAVTAAPLTPLLPLLIVGVVTLARLRPRSRTARRSPPRRRP